MAEAEYYDSDTTYQEKINNIMIEVEYWQNQSTMTTMPVVDYSGRGRVLRLGQSTQYCDKGKYSVL